MKISMWRRVAGGSRPVATRTKAGMPIEVSGGGPRPHLLPTQAAADTYLGGSGRGQYLWYPAAHPAPVPAGQSGVVDSYVRFLWRDVEQAPRVYNWQVVDDALAAAAARGGRLGTRFMPFHQGIANSLPDDVAALASTRTITLDGVASRLPDWNNTTYIARWTELMAAAAARYDNDPRLFSIDVGGYGNWGEGHNYPYEAQYPGPGGQTEGTPATLRSIVRAATGAFTKTWVYYNPHTVRTNNALDVAASADLLNYALTQSTRVGLRTDALGGGTIQDVTVEIVTAAHAASSGAAENDRPLGRWRIAPATSEWPGGTSTWGIRPGGTDGGFAAGARQVRDWHISAVSNANFHDDDNGYIAYSAVERAAFDDACRVAGYRYATSGVRGGLSSGSAVLAVSWVNTGTAPTYDQWQMSYRLTDGTGQTISTSSSLDLRRVLPGGAVVDIAVIPGLIAGRHTLAVRAENTTCSYLPPLQVASGARDAQGWHSLGYIDLA